jgi:hypothetical protein
MTQTSLNVLCAGTSIALCIPILLTLFVRVSFHPITNRKHHCRLCGRIICSLPVKHPQRLVTCSLLFVSDPKSGQIEEVKEGVDYGVRRRTLSSVGHGASRDGINPDERFLRGVRICRDCRPALLWGILSHAETRADILLLRRKQYAQDRVQFPTFSKLYDVFMSLEKEIEDALPQFQELLLTLRQVFLSSTYNLSR